MQREAMQYDDLDYEVCCCRYTTQDQRGLPVELPVHVYVPAYRGRRFGHDHLHALCHIIDEKLDWTAFDPRRN